MDFQPLEMFKKATSFIYREIGVLRFSNHPGIHEKRSNKYGFFDSHRKRLARELYHKTKYEDDPRAILEAYEEATGLTLEDIHLAFSEGNWRAGGGKIYYGGPKWAEVAQATIKLLDALLEDDEDGARDRTERLECSEHNSGRLVDKFIEL